MRLAGAVALVTGASSGIGAAVAKAVAVAGARPLLVGRDAARLAEVADQTGGAPIVADLARPDGVAEAAEQARQAAPRIDLLVNNAGTGWAGRFEAMAEEEIHGVVAVNLLAPIRLTRQLVPAMAARGRIVFVTSIAGCTGVAEEAMYSAAKAGTHRFADALRHELAASGIGVSVVVPGVVDTPFFSRRGRPYDRSWPRPIPAARVAAAVLEAVTRERDEVFVPPWMRLPARLNGAVPAVYRALAGRFG